MPSTENLVLQLLTKSGLVRHGPDGEVQSFPAHVSSEVLLMGDSSEKVDKKAPESGASTRHVRLPGFLVQEEIGLGDVIKRATAAVGIRSCGGCDQRAAALNARIVFSPRR
jgi:hypothetical protein